jgi:hypothetical protein
MSGKSLRAQCDDPFLRSTTVLTDACHARPGGRHPMAVEPAKQSVLPLAVDEQLPRGIGLRVTCKGPTGPGTDLVATGSPLLKLMRHTSPASKSPKSGRRYEGTECSAHMCVDLAFTP